MDIRFFDPNRTANASAWRVLPNRWDAVAFPLIIGILAMAIVGFHQTLAPIATLQSQKISLDPSNLPEYALRTTLRMLAAMVASLVFTLVYGTLAAKSRRIGMVLIPILDILQSVPVLGYISFTVTFFLALFPGRVLGAELAAIFAIFTSQAWNMTFSFYQSLRTVPRDLSEVSRGFHLTSWQRFWKLEVPFSMPGLIWNMMMSMSGGWFFVVASEAITVGNQTITLPGIGAYLAQAISDKNLGAVGWVIVAMSVVILAYDQFLFRPLVAWADKFRMENTASGDAPQSWLLDMMRRTHLIHQLLVPAGWLLSQTARIPLRAPSLAGARSRAASVRGSSRIGDIVWGTFVILITVYVAWRVVSFVATGVTMDEVGHVLVLGLITLLRVLVLIAIASVVWVPLGVLIGLRPALAEKIQPLAQFLAAFPANLLFPVFVIVIVHFHLNADIWLSPLIVLGTQWYILFNVIAGAMSYPNDYKEATKNFRIRGWQWWRQAILPGIFPYYVTGAITASGGAWNASIVSEFVQWGDTKVVAHGLGSYIAQTTAAGDFPKIILGIAVMSLFVTLFNRLLWRPMYAYAESRLRLD
ncbi:binding--dependent transport system inner membrane component family protein [Burkholderia ambifaria AMMD]|uniref:Binding-protein-dependent transport systems inner membrane component n=1 Tax=Burkholderia ambifaria (strain ATCC BAA-244 / DSM 16087 / CCUG 44356 / LMG 19182 / AMMD) TaxID=339670 RepID=Q0B830_BURCM|nr:ABC transporter permease subunit [Burkholderia ambifaria]ABI89693.1 binding-protein-dependent transport systems inner membrane component [Burkholderia ambifaria AMMD]AJY24192.1 binding--dependent transport system inner membrane component family protein [Burkholderia ambifaria AMMD]MBR7930233.1 ABC transporter permease subunit [Burkholderia ambifaria]PEH67808.1 sulfonate ABC transporter permease [Burkholderia ambifaria]QQC07652.1 ABC transporter permease subunit [Burkholderia ambifaria]